MVEKYLTGELTIGLVYEIAGFKSLAWPRYSVQDHFTWILVSPADERHFIYYHDNKIVAYMTAFLRTIKVDDRPTITLCTGNLCSSDGFGFVLTRHVFSYPHVFALGFCNKELLSYHSLSGWKLADKKKLTMPNVDLTKTEVIYQGDFNTLEYNGQKF
jgi:hypothetical protein